MATGELLLTEGDVLFKGDAKQQIGYMRVFERCVQWCDADKRAVFSIMYKEISGQRVSSDTKPKVQLQLRPHRGDAQTFEFIGGHSAQEKLDSRNRVKDAIQLKIVFVRQEAHDARQPDAPKTEEGDDTLRRAREETRAGLKEKEKLLAKSVTLRHLYEDLVVTKVVTAKEFWHYYTPKQQHKCVTSSLEGEEGQSTGISPAFLSTIKQSDGCNNIKFTVSSDTMKAIFATYPNVRQRHLASVPNEMDEESFWRSFFESHYFDRHKVLAKDSMFAQCIRQDRQDMQASVMQGVANSVLDVRQVQDSPYDESPDVIAFDANKPSTSTQRHALMQQFNYHSSRVLNANLDASTVHKSLPTTSTAVHACEETASRKRPHVGDEQHLVCRRISDDRHHSFRLGSQGSDDGILGLTNGDAHEGEHSSEAIRIEVAQLKDSLMSDVDPLACSVTLSDVNSADVRSTSPHVAEARNMHFTLCELLRHFWHCFPPSSQAAIDKIHTMAKTVTAFRDGKLSAANGDVGYLMNMCTVALGKYEEWSKTKTKS